MSIYVHLSERNSVNICEKQKLVRKCESDDRSIVLKLLEIIFNYAFSVPNGSNFSIHKIYSENRLRKNAYQKIRSVAFFSNPKLKY